MAIAKTLLAAFERFWAVYPSRPDNPKAAARAVFERRVREGANPEAIIAGAAVYARCVAEWKRDPAFIPHARTWLTQRRWEDFAEVAPASAGPGQRNPEHPLVWLAPIIGAEAWDSWIAPCAVLIADDAVTVITLTHIAADHVRRHWGEAIATHYGASVRVQRRD